MYYNEDFEAYVEIERIKRKADTIYKEIGYTLDNGTLELFKGLLDDIDINCKGLRESLLEQGVCPNCGGELRYEEHMDCQPIKNQVCVDCGAYFEEEE